MWDTSIHLKCSGEPVNGKMVSEAYLLCRKQWPPTSLCGFSNSKKRSLAVVVDEFGGISGIVALEDLVEEILGEIEDEHDTTSTVAKQLAENEYIFSGRVDIEKANETFNLDLPESENYQTIGGLILNECQSIPKGK